MEINGNSDRELDRLWALKRQLRELPEGPERDSIKFQIQKQQKVVDSFG
jgi:hypothetical protein